MEIALATSNPHKVRETGEILASLGIKLISPKNFIEVIEDGDTFEANAAIKAVANAKLNKIFCVGEDSGLEVNALDKMPGVFSARYSEMEIEIKSEVVPREVRDLKNNQKLLRSLEGHLDRSGSYVCALALANPDGEIIFTDRGECNLTVGLESRGLNGFGYDFICSPIEFPNRTFSELSPEEKNQISHRSKAWAKLIKFLSAGPL